MEDGEETMETDQADAEGEKEDAKNVDEDVQDDKNTESVIEKVLVINEWLCHLVVMVVSVM